MAARDMPPHGPTAPYDGIIDSSNIQCHICTNVRVTSWAAIGHHLRYVHDVDDFAGFIGLQIQLDKCGPISNEEVAHVSIDRSSELHFYCRKCLVSDADYMRITKISARVHFERHHPRVVDQKWFVIKDGHVIKNKSGKQLLLTRAMHRHVTTAPTVRKVTEAAGGDDDECGESSSPRGAPSDIPPDQSYSDNYDAADAEDCEGEDTEDEELTERGNDEEASDGRAGVLAADTCADEPVTVDDNPAVQKLGARSKSAPMSNDRSKHAVASHLDLHRSMEPGLVWGTDAAYKCAEGSASSDVLSARIERNSDMPGSRHESDATYADAWPASDEERALERTLTAAFDTAAEQVVDRMNNMVEQWQRKDTMKKTQ